MNSNSIYSITKRFIDKYNLVAIRKLYYWEQKQIGRLKKIRDDWAMRPERPRLRQFQNLHVRQKRCFIIGNGPSILQQDLTKLKNEIVFVNNSFVRHDQYREINPTYYCVTADLINRNEFYAEWYPLMLKKTKKTPKFFSLRARPFIGKHKLFANHQLYYLNCRDTPIWQTRAMSLDITREVHYGSTLIIDFCLPLAFYMGFSEIYLVGCDCDFKLDEAEDLSKGYFYPVSMAPNQRMVEEHDLSWYDKVTKSYAVAKETFEQHGRTIYNAGVGGKLEIFERVNYNDLF